VSEQVNPVLAWGRVHLKIPRRQKPWNEGNRRDFESAVATGQFPPSDFLEGALATAYQKPPRIAAATHAAIPSHLSEHFHTFNEADLENALLGTSGFRIRDRAEPIHILARKVTVPSGDFDEPTKPTETGPSHDFEADLLLGIGSADIRIVHAELKCAGSNERATQATYQILMYWCQLAGHWRRHVETTVARQHRVMAAFDEKEVWLLAPNSYFHPRWGRDGEALPRGPQYRDLSQY